MHTTLRKDHVLVIVPLSSQLPLLRNDVDGARHRQSHSPTSTSYVLFDKSPSHLPYTNVSSARFGLPIVTQPCLAKKIHLPALPMTT